MSIPAFCDGECLAFLPHVWTYPPYTLRSDLEPFLIHYKLYTRTSTVSYRIEEEETWQQAARYFRSLDHSSSKDIGIDTLEKLRHYVIRRKYLTQQILTLDKIMEKTGL